MSLDNKKNLSKVSGAAIKYDDHNYNNGRYHYAKSAMKSIGYIATAACMLITAAITVTEYICDWNNNPRTR